MSTIQNQTVLFVPHLDLCVKASNTPAHPLKHNFKHHKLVYVSCRSVGVLFPCKKKINPVMPGISAVAKEVSLNDVR